MGWFWQSLTDAQATIISAVLTIVAAVAGVSLGARMFGNRVRDLQGALDASKVMVDDHRQYVESALNEIRRKLSDFETLFGTTLESLGQLRGSLGDISAGTGEAAKTEKEQATLESIRDAWDPIRDTLEAIAANPDIDGRTRAKYARIDRRNYNWLVDALDDDGALRGRGELFRQAVALWHKYRTNKLVPPPEAVSKMSALRSELVQLAPVAPK